MVRQNRARTGETIDEILHGMVIRNPKYSVPQLAELLGVQEWIIYEWANPGQKREFPLSMLLPLTRLTADTSLLEDIAGQAGLVTFRVRRRVKTKLERVEDLQENMQTYAGMLKLLVYVFKDDEKVNKREIIQQIDRFMSDLARIRQDVENLSDQLDLSLEE